MAERRDFVMARIGAAKVYCSSAKDALDAVMEHFVDPEEDRDANERKEALDAASDAAGEMSRSIELAQAALEALNKNELAEEEPEMGEEE